METLSYKVMYEQHYYIAELQSFLQLHQLQIQTGAPHEYDNIRLNPDCH